MKRLGVDNDTLIRAIQDVHDFILSYPHDKEKKEGKHDFTAMLNRHIQKAQQVFSIHYDAEKKNAQGDQKILKLIDSHFNMMARMALGMWVSALGQINKESYASKYHSYLKMLLETMPIGCKLDEDEGNGMIVEPNYTFCEMFGYTAEELQSLNWKDLTPPRLLEQGEHLVQETVQTGKFIAEDKVYMTKDGREVPIILYYKAIDHPILNRRVLLCFTVDISQTKRYQRELEKLTKEQQETIEVLKYQQELINKVSAPVIPIWNKILMVPFIGTFDSNRMQRVEESLFETVTAQRPKHILIDLSGISVVDTHVINEIVQLFMSLRLLGIQTILVGINPNTAQQLVGIGARMEHIPTYATLEQGLRKIINGKLDDL